MLDASKPDTYENHDHYKIKLFRNGVFQVPGIKNPDMLDLVKPIRILKEYLAYNFAEDVQVVNFLAVMRNYKACLLNKHYHVNLEHLEEIILREKIDPEYEQFLNYMLRDHSPDHCEQIKDLMGNFNPMNIAEMTYNTDRCFCLIIKFYRPSLIDPNKKTTVKLLKKGKINFDGGNSQQEIEEFYAWLEYIYHKYKDEILFDIREIKNETDPDDIHNGNPDDSIYDDDLSSDADSDTDDKKHTDVQTKKEYTRKAKTKYKTKLDEQQTRDPSDLIMQALQQSTPRPVLSMQPRKKQPAKIANPLVNPQ